MSLLRRFAFLLVALIPATAGAQSFPSYVNALPSATLPLGGTDVVPVIQSGAAAKLAGVLVGSQTITWGTAQTCSGSASGGGTAATLAAAGSNCNLSLQANGSGVVGLGGTTIASASLQIPTTVSSVDFLQIAGSVTGSPGVVTMQAGGTDATVGVALVPKGGASVWIGGGGGANAGLQVQGSASAVNQIVAGAALTGSSPFLVAGGASADATAGITYGSLGTGPIFFDNAGNHQFKIQTVGGSTVDYLLVQGVGTGNPAYPPLIASGSDTNIGIAIQTKGTGSVFLGGISNAAAGLQVQTPASSVNQILTGSATTGNNPFVIAGGASSDATVGAIFGSAGTGPIFIDNSPNGHQFKIQTPGIGATTVDYLAVAGAATGSPAFPVLAATGTDANVGISIETKGTGGVFLGGGSNAAAGLQVATVASAVNQIVATPAASGSVPSLLAGGSGADAAEAITYGTLGTGNINFATGGATNFQVKITNTAAAVDFFSLTGSATGTPGTITASAVGSDTNVNIALSPKGTGLVTLGTLCTASGGSPQTCNGQRGVVTTASLSTAASTAAAAYTINDTSVATTSVVTCMVNAYSGTWHTNGVPVIAACIPGAGTITVQLQNVDTANALNGTVGIGFVVH